MLCALIMAGGKGTRFWPVSTEKKPKQFLKLVSEKTMLQLTVERIAPLIPIQRIFICTIAAYQEYVFEQLPNLPKENVIIEPYGKNTAPCILMSIKYIKDLYGDSKIVVLPSDHIVNNQKEFLNILHIANLYLDEDPYTILTMGIIPSRIETNYGYIKIEGKERLELKKIYKADRFVEKPNYELAQYFYKNGRYLWNSGIFVFTINHMMECFRLYAENLYKILWLLPDIKEKSYKKKLNELYIKCEPISIDYAIMEKVREIHVIPCDFGWDDIGSWNSLERYLHKDHNHNIHKGYVKLKNSYGNIIFAENKRIIVDGLNDIYCVQANDYVIIGRKERLKKIHEFNK